MGIGRRRKLFTIEQRADDEEKKPSGAREPKWEEVVPRWWARLIPAAGQEIQLDDVPIALATHTAEGRWIAGQEITPRMRLRLPASPFRRERTFQIVSALNGSEKNGTEERNRELILVLKEQV